MKAWLRCLILESTGLRGSLGCSSAIYEAELVEFFQNASVRDGKLVSTVQDKAVEISEELFAGTLELPTEGLLEMSDVPKDLPTKIKFGLSIEIPRVNDGDWYKASLPKIAVTDKGKTPLVAKDKIKGHPAREMFSLICADIEFLVQLREKVIDEIVSFFSSFSLRRLVALGPLSDIAAKEENILVWAETGSLQTTVNRHLYIIAKYREMLLRKFLEARYKNFKSGQPTTANDLQILEMLSDDHFVALKKLKEQMRVHNLEWTRPISSRLIEGAERDPIVPMGPVVDRTCIPKRNVNNVQYNIQIVDSLRFPSTDSVTADPVVDTVTDSKVALDTSQRSPDADLVSPSSYSDSPMRFTIDDIPLGDEPTDVIPPDLTLEFAQLRASVDQISLEHVQTKIQIERLKAEFFAKISILETLPLTRADNQDRAARVQTEIFCKEVKDQKAALSEEFEDQLAVIQNDLLEFRVETQEQYTTLRDNRAELLAFFNRGCDDKKGKVGSSQGQGPQPPPDDRNIPGGGGGS
ncbi:hypothetical protein F511_41613 [Dorcoceras hygrometricum]|uniref:Uncharacterized protein n=1 Tax=Dorcoceras hygrometricum TaxID=472368 RepID=A0A2Z7B079_9LAMI|nr:hypothetical protein F511_41613 [Dorcoceras hygrometricum]